MRAGVGAERATMQLTGAWLVVHKCLLVPNGDYKTFVIHLCDSPKRLIRWWTAFLCQIGGVSPACGCRDVRRRLCRHHRRSYGFNAIRSYTDAAQTLFQRPRTRGVDVGSPAV